MLFIAGQPSQGADGESEYLDEGMEEDELISESEEPEVCRISLDTSNS
jgi:SWI/SNF-related matrix-associated actin-dependent regulator of chromatin subfamily A member 5